MTVLRCRQLTHPGRWAVYDALHLEKGSIQAWHDAGDCFGRLEFVTPVLSAGCVFGVEGRGHAVVVWDANDDVLANLRDLSGFGTRPGRSWLHRLGSRGCLSLLEM